MLSGKIALLVFQVRRLAGLILPGFEKDWKRTKAELSRGLNSDVVKANEPEPDVFIPAPLTSRWKVYFPEISPLPFYSYRFPLIPYLLHHSVYRIPEGLHRPSLTREQLELA